MKKFKFCNKNLAPYFKIFGNMWLNSFCFQGNLILTSHLLLTHFKWKLQNYSAMRSSREDFRPHLLISISSIYLVIIFDCSENIMYRRQAFSKANIIVNNSFQGRILWRIYPETDSTGKVKKAASMLLLTKSAQMLKLQWLKNSVDCLTDFQLFSKVGNVKFKNMCPFRGTE